MRGLPVLFFLIIGCSGSGATVSDSTADIEQAPPVEPSTPTSTPVNPATRIACTTSDALSDGAVHTISFALRDGALESEITVEPSSSVLAPLTKATLEKNGGKVVLVTRERAELALFENSDLTRGYVRAANEFSNVVCEKR